MAGRIRAEDVTLVKERAAIADVVGEFVTLRRAGSSLTGLCPFHDEKTPSFNVSPATGYYHCYGCGEGGDVISFLVKAEHLSFTEAVERLAAKAGVQLRYEEGGAPQDRLGPGRRSRLVEAHRVAQEFYESLLLSPAARAGRDFLRARGFDGAVARRFGIGFAPRGGEELVGHLRAKGFTDDEVTAGGLAGRGSRGLYDRFRGRLVWPIRDITSDVVGFGARRLFDDDRIEAKYLNTAETPIYRKSSVLYGLDLAKKAMSRERTAVIVEGYTDVMACHLAGIETAVATCGTAFGAEHVKVLRRILRDEPDLAPARVVFTFDGDAAGQAGAMRAFKEDQRWASQSFVAVEASGKDPCELRQSAGDPAVRALVEDAVPMFEFAVRTTIGRFDLDTAEGRAAALRAAAPVVAGIRDRALRPEYTRTVAGWLGVDVEQVRDEVSRAGRAPSAPPPRQYADPPESAVEPSAGELRDALPMPDLRDPVVQAERQLLQCVLQYPDSVDPALVSGLAAQAFSAPAHQAVYAAVLAAGLPSGRSTAAWHAAVADLAPAATHPVITDLAVGEIPVLMDPATGRPTGRYVAEVFARVHEIGLTREVADAIGQLRRLDAAPSPDASAHREVGVRLQALQRELADLRSRGAQ
ncbi:MAG: DNA primase [Dermatophilaceae bacterium]